MEKIETLAETQNPQRSTQGAGSKIFVCHDPTGSKPELAVYNFSTSRYRFLEEDQKWFTDEENFSSLPETQKSRMLNSLWCKPDVFGMGIKSGGSIPSRKTFFLVNHRGVITEIDTRTL
jgi:hypothetical protein